MRRCLECGKETKNKKFCSLSCSSTYRGRKENEKAIQRYYKNPKYCLECGNIIDVIAGNRVCEVRRQEFCSRSCSATYHNKNRTSENRVCPACGGVKDYRASLCKDCLTKKQWEEALGSSIQDYFCTGASRAKYNSIRQWARKIMEESGVEKKCLICGFTVCVEVCHKKALKDFSPAALLGEVNSLDNLVYLCPNHHAMLDKELLSLI